nr:MAG TPA: hypothetical protein [Caudoviricetes sp.]
MRDILLLAILLLLSMVAGWFSPIAPCLDMAGFVHSHTALGLYVIGLAVYMNHRKEA